MIQEQAIQNKKELTSWVHALGLELRSMFMIEDHFRVYLAQELNPRMAGAGGEWR